MNVRIVPPRSGAGWTASELERRHLLAILLDYARGVVLTALGLLVLGFVVDRVVPLWELGEPVAEAALWAIVAGMIASTIRMLGSRFWFVAAGAAAALILVLV